ncbi:LysR family transcriptional regulator [Arthrobacter sp. USHLN218]|uniref:LysR family transcriptional regulator n=1 Tax=Arthrobacter sp. USHLN218 TaxID=3081232 RepID=UPI00301664AC
MDVELRHLRALVTLEDSDTFTTAAAVLGTTQPTLSRTIAQLEQIVEVPLVDRSTRWVRFTAAGRRLAAEARILLVQLDNTLAGLHDDASRPLRLGWAWAGLGAHTVPLLEQWRHASNLPVEPSRPQDPESALLNQEIDAAIIRRALPADPLQTGLNVSTLFSESLVAAVARTSPLAARSALSLSDLAPGPIAVCRTAPTATARLWENAGRKPYTITVANTDEWLARISVGDALGLTSATTAYSHQDPDVAYLPVEDSPRVEVILAWPSTGSHPQAAAFADFARGYFTRLISGSTPPAMFAQP